MKIFVRKGNWRKGGKGREVVLIGEMQRKIKCRFGNRTTKKEGWESESYEEFRERKYKELPDEQRMIKRPYTRNSQTEIQKLMCTNKEK